MISNKLFITAIVISVIIHMAILAVSGVLKIGGNSCTDTSFTVHLKKQPESLEKKGKPDNIIVTPEPTLKTAESKIKDTEDREDTVELGSKNTKYFSYLKQLKRKIANKWLYPEEACARQETGTAVVRFSIAEEGILVDSLIISSSGHDILDSEALRVVRAAGPFNPLPKKFNLSKLHIIAQFRYNLAK
jgi:protein TonB